MGIRTELLTPDQPRLRAGDLHRHRRRARHDHDDDGLVGRRRPARQLARPAHDRVAAAWRSPGSRPSRSGCFTAGYLVILTALPLGGFPTGWTGYAPLQTQATGGMDSYLVGFAVIGLGMILAGFNLAGHDHPLPGARG